MPSFRKVVEDVEYNTLPSPTKEGFAAAVRANKPLKTDKNFCGNLSKKLAPEKGGSVKNVAVESKDGVNDKTVNANNATSGAAESQQEVIEINSDDENINLNDLATLKDRKSTVVKPVQKETSDLGEAVNTSKEIAKPNFNNGGANGKGLKTSESGTNGSSTAKSSVAKAHPAQLTKAITGKQEIVAPQIQQPYSSNPTVRNSATTILNNIRHNLQQTMPVQPQPTLQPFPNGPAANVPGMERWSEHRIDSASTIEDLESIKSRLLTLTKRVDLRLKEMLFLKAIGMPETAGAGEERKSTSELIRELTEQAESNLLVKKPEDGDLKRKRADDKPDDTEEEKENGNNEKHQRSDCCPFCLSTNSPRENDEYLVCSICDERSNACEKCRGYCTKCHRQTCEDCLMRCDSCFSDTFCSDCMSTSGQCPKCSSKKSKTNYTSQFRSNGGIRAVSQSNIPIVAQQPIGQNAGNMPLQSARPSAVGVNHTLHRFIVTQTGALGLVVRENGATAIEKVHEQSHAEKIGLKKGDEICFAFTNGERAFNTYKKFIQAARSRPMVFEIRRKIDPSNTSTLHRFYITQEGPLGLTVKQCFTSGGQCTLISAVQSDKLGNMYGLCVGDAICQPFANGATFLGVYNWFMEAVKCRPLVFDVWRNNLTRPSTDAENTVVPPLKRTPNPFVWSIGS